MSTEPSQKILRRSISTTKTLDPQLTSAAVDQALENAIFRGLLRYDDQELPAPSVAKEVPTVGNGGISVDGLTYTYNLRHDWNWSDNSGVVTAQDFVYTFERLVEPDLKSPYGTIFNDIIVNAKEISQGKEQITQLGVEAQGDFTFVVHLVKPIAYFNQLVGLPFTFVVKQKNVERFSSSPTATASTASAVPLHVPNWYDPANGEVVGSGPFIVTEWSPKTEIDFKRNPYFAGTPAKLDGVQIFVFNDNNLPLQMYKNGDLDISPYPLGQYNALQADPVLSQEIQHYPVSCTNYLVMNNSVFPFNIREVRQAFTFALDRDARSQQFTHSLNSKQLSLLPPGLPGYDANLGFDVNPTAAKAALANAMALFPQAFPGGKFPTVNFYFHAPADKEVADFYQSQFKTNLGVDVVPTQLSDDEYNKKLYDEQGSFDGLWQYGWCSDYLYPSDWLYFVWGSNQGNNIAHYSNPAFDALSQAADTQLDQKLAIPKYQQAQELLVNDFPVIFYETPQVTRLVKPSVLHLKPSPIDGGLEGALFWEDIDLSASTTWATIPTLQSTVAPTEPGIATDSSTASNTTPSVSITMSSTQAP